MYLYNNDATSRTMKSFVNMYDQMMTLIVIIISIIKMTLYNKYELGVGNLLENYRNRNSMEKTISGPEKKKQYDERS